MQSTIRFGEYLEGPWTHGTAKGVGIEMAGAPVDPYGFLELMLDLSCPATAARRILDQLEAGEPKLTTVTAVLDFKELGDKLARLGVRLRIVAPAQVPAKLELDSIARIILDGDTLDLSTHSAEDQLKVQSYIAQAQASWARLPALSWEAGR